mmetsp:Transcript_10647/g.19771  ORF Transcript_10647/g.19771 Transcript_10647/m.19771 type:complete len:209 (-) Transcript_10647:179-805(-)
MAVAAIPMAVAGQPVHQAVSSYLQARHCRAVAWHPAALEFGVLSQSVAAWAAEPDHILPRVLRGGLLLMLPMVPMVPQVLLLMVPMVPMVLQVLLLSVLVVPMVLQAPRLLVPMVPAVPVALVPVELWPVSHPGFPRGLHHRASALQHREVLVELAAQAALVALVLPVALAVALELPKAAQVVRLAAYSHRLRRLTSEWRRSKWRLSN